MTISKKPTAQKTAKLSKHNPEKASAILLGALEVFATHGYAAASMDRIASSAGVSKPTVYSYFQDKEGLFIALIQQLTRRADQTLRDLQSGQISQMPPAEGLRLLALTALEDFTQNQRLPTFMRLIIGESERFPELAKTFVREVQKPLLERLQVYFASQPQLKLADPEVAARIFAGSIVHYLLVQEVMHGKEILPLERDRMVDGLVSQMLAGSEQ
ncbi:MAG: TetR/AcrR family transcriptional regulator [Phormidesmis sp.]